eukprot:TRINITY_DN3807_c0_g2_i1.p1 TRINITY_DN3807_c0_g2~~TRINITY_DN3807_c0_g2_i1.p1  ORF type:complete len:569 (+),score=111.48 TRINITY_DN3807_c0_g2_i1:340-2046(+)
MRFNARLKSFLEIELCALRTAGKAKILSPVFIYSPLSERMVTSAEKGKEMERAKAVPDWLNSSIWSSTRPSDPNANQKANRSSRNIPKEIAAGMEDPFRNAPKETNVSSSVGMEDPLRQHHAVGNSSTSVITSNVEHNAEQRENIHCVSQQKEESINQELKRADEDLGQKPSVASSKRSDDPLSDSWVPPSNSLSEPAALPSNQSLKRSPSVDNRHKQFQIEISKKVIDLPALQRLASQGIPDVGGLRATVWKLLCGYIPTNRDQWGMELSRKRAEYAAFKEELLVNPSEISRKMEGTEGEVIHVGDKNERGFLRRSEITHGDHPLSMGSTSVWNKFFEDTEIIEQIERDVKRTHPDMHFFSGDSALAIENEESLKRILLIFAKLNPGIRYVQGMNEVVAPLFYVFKTDPNQSDADNAEPDAFFCFVQLLSNFRDHFCQQLDNSVVGIRSTMSQLSMLLKKHDEELWRHLEITTKVNPHFYAFRWITLLLTQEFSFPDCLRIWDSILGNQDGPLEILLRICCAMLMCIRSRLLGGDFTMNLKLLQHYPYVDTNHLLQVAEQLKTKAAD